MAKSKTAGFLIHLRTYMFRGLLAIIPLLLCALAIQFLYVFIDQKIMHFLGNFFEIRQIPGVGILLLLLSLYLIGLIASNIIGSQLFKYLENLSQRIPLIKFIYSIGKQLSQSLLGVGDQKQPSLKKAVLVKLGNGVMVPAFVMSSMIHPVSKEEFLFILVSTAPTPAGFVIMVKASEVIDPGWSVEECMKVVVSMGLMTPKDIKNI